MTPIIWIIILLGLSLGLKNPKKSRKTLIITVIVFLFFSNSFIVDEFIRLWELPITGTKYLTENYNVGIVLGGGMVTFDKKNDRIIFRENVDRILQAVELYKTDKIKKILISGGSGSLVFNEMIESVILKKYLITIGIPENDIIIDSISKNTHENAVQSSYILKKNYPDSNYLLITSALHMRRALACFNKEGIKPASYCTNKIVGERRFDIYYLFIPKAENFILWENLIHEVSGYFVYSVFGYI
ncbi:MAG: YdcF family protein [Bacteroidales bacterium]|nr:YdcF family protein [Bacteroidales bacterium]